MKLMHQSFVPLLGFAFIGFVIQQSPTLAQTAYISQIQGKGKVELKRKTASSFYPVTRVPTPIAQDDQLRITNGMKVMVACLDGKNRPIRRAGERTGLTEICGVWKGIIYKAPSPLVIIGGINPQIPYLLSPRRTLLLNNTPTLRWNPVPGATQYTVQIVGPKGPVWQTQVKEPQVTYSDNSTNSTLQPATLYSVVIQSNTGKSSQEEESKGIEFIILREAEAKAVKAEVNAILQSDLSEEVKALKLANYYSSYQIEPSAYGFSKSEDAAKGYRLYANASAVLENLIAKGNHSPLLYRTLANLYWQTGLMRPAEEAYARVIEIVQSPGDLEEWSLAMFGLGEIYEATQNLQQAFLWYSQARIGFILLDDQRVAALNLRIKRLKKTTSNLLNQ
jgi:hypothetical protein